MVPIPSSTYLRLMEEAARRTTPSRRHDREVEDLLLEAQFMRHADDQAGPPGTSVLRRLTLRLRALVSQTA